MRSLITQIRKLRVKKEEISTILLYGLAIGFFLSFDNWGVGSQIDVGEGFYYFISYTLSALATLAIYMYGSKIIGQSLGVSSYLKTSYIGLFFSFIVVILSEGKLPFFIPPGFDFEMHKDLLKGRFYRHQTHKDFALSGLGSLLTQLIVISLISSFFDSIYFFSLLGEVLILSIIYSLIPFDLILKPFEKRAGLSIGTAIIFKSRGLFVFVVSFVIVMYLVTIQFSLFISLLISTLVAFIMYLYYIFQVDK